MNWEMVGWLAFVVSGCVIVASFVTGGGKSATTPTAKETTETFNWLELAWPVNFISAMGLLTLREVLTFSAVLLLATVLTGVIWLVDIMVMRKSRAAGGAEPVVVEMARSFFPVILIVFVLRSFLFEPFKIPSGSMVPSLLVGDFILVNKFTYGIRIPVLNKKIVGINNPQRGDVMVFRYPVDPAKDYIKRVIGLPGDTIAYRNKRLSVNGKLVEVTPAGVFTEVNSHLQMRQFDVFSEKLGDKPHLMMTDPHAASLNLGSVSEFPQKRNCEYNDDGMLCKVPAGHYLMIGDSRDNSLDGRYWGFVPEENIVGKAVLVWMNFSELKRVGHTIE